jgi:hypothetical protein
VQYAPPASSEPPGDVVARIDALERTVAALARDLNELRKKLGEEP